MELKGIVREIDEDIVTIDCLVNEKERVFETIYVSLRKMPNLSFDIDMPLLVRIKENLSHVIEIVDASRIIDIAIFRQRKDIDFFDSPIFK